MSEGLAQVEAETDTSTAPMHLVRPHLFAHEQSYELEANALRFRHRGKTKVIPYTDIRSVRLIDYANFGELQGQCTITTRGHGKLKIRSHHFAGIGNFENRTATYVPFVREMCRRLQAAQPGTEFLKGSGWLQVLWLVVLACTALAWVFWLSAINEGGQDFATAASYFVGLLLATGFGLRWFSRSKPEHFDPADPPLAWQQS